MVPDPSLRPRTLPLREVSMVIDVRCENDFTCPFPLIPLVRLDHPPSFIARTFYYSLGAPHPPQHFCYPGSPGLTELPCAIQVPAAHYLHGPTLTLFTEPNFHFCMSLGSRERLKYSDEVI